MNRMLKLLMKGHVWLYRTSNGRRGANMGKMKVLLLTTHGRKSNKQRTVALVPHFERDQMFVMASMGGAPQHPSWFFNLERNPDVEVQLGPERFRARAVVLPEPERTEVWSRVKASMSNFGEYETRTTRVIPVVRLERQS